jgi:DNA-binding winged helix-turn-helix (wHTH) protein
VPTRFGEFVFDQSTRELRRGDEVVPLTPKEFQLLHHLLQRRPHAVSKTELQKLVWPDIHVTDASLASAVSGLRAALEDRRRRPLLIRTIHGFGYAFCGETTDTGHVAEPRSTSGPVYRLIWNRREIELRQGENILGRDRESVAWLDSASVSRRHARIVLSGDQATLQDLGSRNGTWVGGRKVTAPTLLSDLDEVKLGAEVMVFRVFKTGKTESLS